MSSVDLTLCYTVLQESIIFAQRIRTSWTDTRYEADTSDSPKGVY